MISIVLAILAYILGPLFVIHWTVKRYKSGKRPEFLEIVAVVFAVAMFGVLIYSVTSEFSRNDAAEMTAIMSDLTQRYDFPVQAKFQQIPAVFITGRGRAFDLKIYGVTQREEQEKLILIIKKIRRQIASKPIVVHFMQEEVWLEKEDGTRRPLRDKEISLRRVRVE